MNRLIREEWIKSENDLAEELLNSCEALREEKYTEVYESLYASFTEEKRNQMSISYLRSAIDFSTTLKKVIGTNKKILDIGCGFGHLSYLLASYGNDVIGIDINRIHVQEARQKYCSIKNLKYFETKGVRLNFPDNIFDFIVSTSVFEHLHPDDVDIHLSEVNRVLKKRGKYIFTAITPYSRGDVSQFSKDPEERKKHGLHINEKTWKELYDTVYKHGFKGRTDILPAKFVNKIPVFLFLVPLKIKILLERLVIINNLTVRMFKLGGVFIIATKRQSNQKKPSHSRNFIL